MEYIYSDLPQYIKVNARTDFDNAVVQEGCVLLFSEDGSTLTAKTADGSFVSVGGSGGGVDTSNDTVTADVMLEGFTAHDSDGNAVVGSIKTVALTRKDNTVSVQKGYIAADDSITIESSGVDVSGVTATPEEVLEGYAFVTSSGELMEGVIPIYQISDIMPTANAVFISPGYYAGSDREITIGNAIAPGTITPGTADIVLSQGSFLIDDVTVKGDANLIAANIAEGVTIFGVVGTHAGGSGGGSSATKYYKCMSVNPVSKKWTGVEATKSNDGSFTFDTVVSEFSYADSIVTPIVHSIYPDDCSYEVAKALPIPTEGLVFYEPLGAAPTTTGVTVHGSPTFTTVWGIPCVNLTTNGQGISWNGGMIDDADFASPHTVAIAFCGHNTNTGKLYHRYYMNAAGNTSTAATIVPRVNALDSVDYVSFNYGSNSVNSYTKNIIVNDEWITFILTIDGDNARLYVNGQMFAITSTREFSGGSAEDIRKYVIGGYMPNGDGTIEQLCVGYYANLRFYDRALTADEVMRLHQAFNPVIPFAEGKFTVTGDDYVAGTYYAEPGTKGAERRWMTAWDGTSEERMGIMLFGDGYWTICNFLATYPETPDGDWDTSQPPTWEAGYEMYRDPSLQYDEDYNIIGTPLGMEVAAPDLAGTWKSAGDPEMGSVTVVYTGE